MEIFVSSQIKRQQFTFLNDRQKNFQITTISSKRVQKIQITNWKKMKFLESGNSYAKYKTITKINKKIIIKLNLS